MPGKRRLLRRAALGMQVVIDRIGRNAEFLVVENAAAQIPLVKTLRESGQKDNRELQTL